MATKNAYYLDDALDWLREHVKDAAEDAIARALIVALDEMVPGEPIEMALDHLMQSESAQGTGR